MRLKLMFYEGADVESCEAVVVRRGIDGPAGKGRYWIVETKSTVFIKEMSPASYLIIGPAGKDGRLEVLDEGIFRAVPIQMMMDTTGQAPDINRFDFTTAYDFGRGMALLK